MREGTTRGMGVVTKIYLGTLAQLDAGEAKIVYAPGEYNFVIKEKKVYNNRI